MKLFRKISLLLTVLLFTISFTVFADQPPNPGGGPGGGDEPVGGGAPIGGGLIVLLLASATYGVRKTYFIKSEKE
ncbi:MAG: hypothetical protein R2764_15810 [Bacteroidales bacterium]